MFTFVFVCVNVLCTHTHFLCRISIAHETVYTRHVTCKVSTQLITNYQANNTTILLQAIQSYPRLKISNVNDTIFVFESSFKVATIDNQNAINN